MKRQITEETDKDVKNERRDHRSSVPAQKARYIRRQLPGCCGNVLVEALPEYESFEPREILNMLSFIPKPCARGATIGQRDMWLSSLTRTLFIATKKHVELMNTIHFTLCQGYMGRDPRYSEEENTRMQNDYDRQMAGDKTVVPNYSGLMNGDPISASVIGISGVGKTYSVKHCLSMYPHVIVHSDEETGTSFKQVVYLHVECPSDGSIKDLCCSALQELGRITNDDIGEISTSRISADGMKMKLVKMLRVYHVGLLIIDEIQNLITKRGDRDPLFNYIVSLGNTLNVPLLFLGTPRALTMMRGTDFRVSRRFGSIGVLKWGRLTEDRKIWDRFIDVLWSTNVLNDTPLDIPDDIKQTLENASQGITDTLTKLFILTQKRSLIRKEEIIASAEINQVYDTCFSSIHNAMTALRSNDLEALMNFKDIVMQDDTFCKISSDMTEEVMNTMSKLPIYGDPWADKAKEFIRRSLLLLNYEIDDEIDDEINAYIEKVVADKSNGDIQSLQMDVLNYAFKKTKKGQSKKGQSESKKEQSSGLEQDNDVGEMTSENSPKKQSMPAQEINFSSDE